MSASNPDAPYQTSPSTTAVPPAGARTPGAVAAHPDSSSAAPSSPGSVAQVGHFDVGEDGAQAVGGSTGEVVARWSNSLWDEEQPSVDGLAVGIVSAVIPRRQVWDRLSSSSEVMIPKELIVSAYHSDLVSVVDHRQAVVGQWHVVGKGRVPAQGYTMLSLEKPLAARQRGQIQSMRHSRRADRSCRTGAGIQPPKKFNEDREVALVAYCNWEGMQGRARRRAGCSRR